MARNDELIQRMRSRRGPKSAEKPAGLKSVIEVLSSMLALLTKMALFVGFFALATYLGAAQHVVTGVNLTDAFLLAAIALALGFLGMCVAVLGGAAVFQHVGFVVSMASFGRVADNQLADYREKRRAFLRALALFMVLVPILPVVVAWVSRFLWAGALNHLTLTWLLFSGWYAWGVSGKWVKALGVLRAQMPTQWDRVDELFERFMCAVLLLLSGVLTFLMPVLFSSIGIAVCISACGLLFVVGLHLQIANGPRVRPEWAAGGRVLMCIALVVSVFVATWLPIFNGEKGVVKALQAVSLNVPHATIEVSAANLQRLERVGAQHGLPLQVCRNPDGTATLTDVRVLWHTLGSHGLVELWPESSDPGAYTGGHGVRFQTSAYEQWFRVFGVRGLRVPLENAGLTVSTGSTVRCLELSGLLFDSNIAALNGDALDDLHKQLARLKQSIGEERSYDGTTPMTLQRLEIVGHADPRRRQKGSNEDLAEQRSLAVKAAIEAWIAAHAKEWQPATLSARSQGAREPARKCDSSGPQEEQACHAFNRRVVIRALTGPAPLKASLES